MHASASQQPKTCSSAPLAALLPALPAMHIVKAECSGCSFALLTHMLAPSLQVRWPGSPSFCVHGLLEMRLISTLLLLPRCPPLEKMRGRAPLWSSAAHLLPTAGLFTCSLVNFLVAFFSLPRSSPCHPLRAVPLQHTCMRTARAARACICRSPSSLLLVVAGQHSVAWCDARDLCGPM